MALEVIGVGLGRTGTASLKAGLEKLGLGRCYHMSEVLQKPERMKDWIAAANGNPDWDKIFDGFTCSVDYPGATFWEDLVDYYPDAKFLLTVRDANKWFESANQTVMSAKFREFVVKSPFGEYLQRILYDTVDNRTEDREFMVAHFENHTAKVIEKIPADKLLVFEIQDGWGPLCEFLGVPVPDEDFPRINSRDETQAMLEKIMAHSKGGLDEATLAAAAKKLHEDGAK